MRKYLRSPSQRVGPGVGNRDAAPIEPNTNPFKGGSVSRFPTNRRPPFPSDASPIDPTWKGAPAVRAHISTRIDRILEISERAGRVQVDTREISPTQPGERRHGRQERNGPTACPHMHKDEMDANESWVNERKGTPVPTRPRKIPRKREKEKDPPRCNVRNPTDAFPLQRRGCHRDTGIKRSGRLLGSISTQRHRQT